jgi:hypothetical protein
MRLTVTITTAAVLAAAPAAQAQNLCCGRKLGMTFMEASPDIKLLTLAFVGAAIAAIVTWVRNRRGEPGKIADRTLARLRGWRVGGPMLGAAAAAYLAMNNFVAAYAYPEAPTFRLMAPGLAEIAMVLWAGLLSGGAAALVYAALAGRAAAGRFRGDDPAA